MLWALDSDIVSISGNQVVQEKNLRRVFDFIITLEEPILREVEF